MTVYVAFVEDRHFDPVVKVFADRQRAIDWTRETFRACLAHPDGFEESIGIGLEAAFGYRYESDYAWVKRTEVE